MKRLAQLASASMLSILLLSASIQLPALAESFSLLKDVPVTLDGYDEYQSFPDTFNATEKAIAALENSRHIGVHMEIIRRAYHDLPLDSHEAFLTAVHDRQRAIEDDPYRSFDEGYAQWMFRSKKSALYYLRKVNDKLKSPFTNLAYAMAQAEVDLNDEMASPAVLTRRKQDVTYKLVDAVKEHSEHHEPGFWPSFVGTLEQLAEVPAYQDFIKSDFSQFYVPYGNQVMPNYNAPETTSNPPTSETPQALATEETPLPKEVNHASCTLSTDTSEFNFGNIYRSMSVDIDGDGTNEAIHFFYTDKDNVYKVALINHQNQVLANLDSPVAPYILEDIDNDDLPEIVIRNTSFDLKQQPVKVYRFNDCKYELDQDVEAFFQ